MAALVPDHSETTFDLKGVEFCTSERAFDEKEF
jgi:hypothetical protein